MDLVPQTRTRAAWHPKTSKTVDPASTHHYTERPSGSVGDPSGQVEVPSPGRITVEDFDAPSSANATVMTGASARLVAEIDVPAELHHLIEVRDRAAAIASALGFSDRGIEEVRLAVGEAYVNAVRHGSCEWKGGPARAGATILVRILAAGAAVIVEVKDSGPGFDPALVSLLPADELSAGGRGLFFMKIAMDDVDFDFSEGTLVRMTKRCPLPGAACAS